MTDFKKIFLDTSPIAYYLEKSELYYLNLNYSRNNSINC